MSPYAVQRMQDTPRVETTPIPSSVRPVRTRVALTSSGLELLMVPPMTTSPGRFHLGTDSPVTMASLR